LLQCTTAHSLFRVCGVSCSLSTFFCVCRALHLETSEKLTQQISQREAIISELEFELRQQADDVNGERNRALRAQKLSQDANSYVALIASPACFVAAQRISACRHCTVSPPPPHTHTHTYTHTHTHTTSCSPHHCSAGTPTSRSLRSNVFSRRTKTSRSRWGHADTIPRARCGMARPHHGRSNPPHRRQVRTSFTE
jgi:hypothetical protein